MSTDAYPYDVFLSHSAKDKLKDIVSSSARR